MDCSLSGSSVPGILQARILEWVSIFFSRESSNLGIKPRSPALQVDSSSSESEKPRVGGRVSKYVNSHEILFKLFKGSSLKQINRDHYETYWMCKKKKKSPEGLCLPVLHGGHRGVGSLSHPRPGLRPRKQPQCESCQTRDRYQVQESSWKSGMPLLLNGLDTASDAPAYVPLAKAVHVVEPRVGLGYGLIPGRLCKSQAVGRDVELWSHLWWRRGGDNWDYDLIYDMHFQKWIIYFLVLKKYWEWCHCCVCFMALGHHCQHKYCF